ncbi:hypothetical protein [Nocardia bovistercoris]|uniref:Uncharacterized protein n=1 Tax=Nocardia bovistercoris TaxID=2785916 RepID=A0A931N2S6_9NOCA|nr:hypothetical protein [Nocardia bovistercoris]MBH0779825.1 hypothetical protein [Nocardia bovistercoris]
MNSNQPFILEMAVHIVLAERADDFGRIRWLRSQRQVQTIDPNHLDRAIEFVKRLPDQSRDDLENWLFEYYSIDGFVKGYAVDIPVAETVSSLSQKAHTYYRDLRRG